MKLTSLAVKNAEIRDKQYKLSDGNGLYLLVQPAGKKYWRMNYRFSGKQKTLSFGVYPVISLADARSKVKEAKDLLARDVDPLASRAKKKMMWQHFNRHIFNSISAFSQTRLVKWSCSDVALY